MKIRLLSLFQGPYGKLERGSVVDDSIIPTSVLRQWVTDGYADMIEDVESAAVDHKPEKAVKKRAVKKRTAVKRKTSAS